MTCEKLREKMKIARAVAYAGTFAAITCSTAVQAQQSTMVPMLLCPWGCGPTESNAILMNQMVKDGSSVTLLPQETPGYVYNIRHMTDQKNWGRNVFGVEDVLMQLSYKWGGTPELKEFLPIKVPVKFKLLYGEAWWAQGKFFATYNPSIKSPADFKGKRVALGLRSQTNWGLYPSLILKYAYGITPENTDIRYMTPATLTQQLIDGAVDVAVTGVGTEPNQKEYLITPILRQLEAVPKKLHYIGMSKEAIAKVNAKFGTTFVPITIPAGTVPKQTEPLSTAINRDYMAVAPNFPDELAYNIVMSVAKYAPKMKELHPLWRIWSTDLMVAGLTDDNVSAGAKKAYMELGVWNDTKKFLPVTLPQ